MSEEMTEVICEPGQEPVLRELTDDEIAERQLLKEAVEAEVALIEAAAQARRDLASEVLSALEVLEGSLEPQLLSLQEEESLETTEDRLPMIEGALTSLIRYLVAAGVVQE